MASSTPRRPFEVVANHIVLDFTNTVNARPDFTRDDLRCTDDVIDWACAAGVVVGPADSMRHSALSSDLDGAVALREGVYRVFGAIAAGDDPQPGAVRFVARHAADAIRSSTLTHGETAYQLSWPEHSVEALVHRLADDALQLLRSPAVRRIGACDGCGWLFLDTSRAGGRRWCSMNMCGARHKMRRYHQRQVEAMSDV